MSSKGLKSFTSGEIATFCGVTLRTVIRWIEGGKLKGYKLPGRGNNRVLQSDFLNFLKEHDMPIPDLLKKQDHPTVLIVDDELSMAKAIQRVARRSGLRSVKASDGFQAGVLLTTHQPELMTLDLSMPGLDGFEVIKHIRANSAFDHIKIVVISALPESKLEKALALGANFAFSKPFEQHKLLELFESFID